MDNIAIKAENISKAYQLGEFSTGTLSRDIERWWALMRGKEDPFLAIGETNDRSTKGESDIVWSLKDINFEIRKGDAVGIIGRNGAGKSTLLKLLSRVTTPTSGLIKVNGRIASLLEVGTGFHPELTGRENIFLNGAILGMRKAEIKKHFDAIVDFAGIERYIDTPVKRYSSGMYVRLAFAVAAHLESEILVVDEVLAVGDTEFQKKCLGKMSAIREGEGRTVLFVSHNMASIFALTNTCVFMEKGRIVQKGPTNDIVELYRTANLESLSNNLFYQKKELDANKPIELLSARIEKKDNLTVDLHVTYIVRRHIGSVVSIKLTDAHNRTIITLRDIDRNSKLFAKDAGEYSVIFCVPVNMLAPSVFNVTFSFADMKSERFEYLEDLLSFEIEETNELTQSTASRDGILKPNINYVMETINTEHGKVQF